MSYELTPQIIEELLQHHKEELAEALEQYNAKDVSPEPKKPTPTLPSGWKLAPGEQPRLPKKGEWFWDTGLIVVDKAEGDFVLSKLYILLPDNVYGKPLDEVEIPEGYEPLLENGKRVYRRATIGEHFLCASGLAVVLAASPHSDNRLILVKKQKPQPTVESVYGVPLSKLRIPEGYEATGEFRVPVEGEFYLNYLANNFAPNTRESAYNHMAMSGPYTQPRLILRKTPAPTIESVYGKPLSELKPPKGYVFTGEFRRLRALEAYLMTTGSADIATDWDSTCCLEPRLILRKAKRIVFEETDDNYIRTGDLYEWSNGLHFTSSASYPRENSPNLRTLYRKVNETE